MTVLSPTPRVSSRFTSSFLTVLNSFSLNPMCSTTVIVYGLAQQSSIKENLVRLSQQPRKRTGPRLRDTCQVSLGQRFFLNTQHG